MEEEKLKESKLNVVQDLCVNEFDLIGNNLNNCPNLIMVKVNDQKYLCLTPFDAKKIIERKRFDLYALPNVQIYVDEEFKNLIDQNFNSMEIVPTNKEQSLDYEGNARKVVKVYTVKPIRRCEILGENCNESDMFEDENIVEENVDMEVLLEMARKQREEFERKFGKNREMQEDVKRIVKTDNEVIAIKNDEQIQILIVQSEPINIIIENCPNLVLVKFEKDYIEDPILTLLKIYKCPKLMSLRVPKNCKNLSIEDCPRLYNLKLRDIFSKIIIGNCRLLESIEGEINATKLEIANCPIKILRVNANTIYIHNLDIKKLELEDKDTSNNSNSKVNISNCNLLKDFKITTLKTNLDLLLKSCPVLSNIQVENPENNLETLTIELNDLPIKSIPEFPENSVDTLRIEKCNDLEYFNFPPEVKELVLNDLNISSIDLSKFYSIVYLSLFLNKLKYINVFPSTLQLLQIYSNEIKNIPVLPNKLETVRLKCPQLVEIPNIPTLLKKLICNCSKLDKVPYIDRTIEFVCDNCPRKIKMMENLNPVGRNGFFPNNIEGGKEN